MSITSAKCSDLRACEKFEPHRVLPAQCPNVSAVVTRNGLHPDFLIGLVRDVSRIFLDLACLSFSTVKVKKKKENKRRRRSGGGPAVAGLAYVCARLVGSWRVVCRGGGCRVLQTFFFLGSSKPPSNSPGNFTRPSYFLRMRTSTRPSYSSGSSRSAQNLGKAECSNCKFLAEKIKTLEAKIKILEGALEMERHP
ncbi:hypothetical protein Tco_0756569 [Tanacetum coccineum]